MIIKTTIKTRVAKQIPQMIKIDLVVSLVPPLSETFVDFSLGSAVELKGSKKKNKGELQSTNYLKGKHLSGMVKIE